MKGSPLMAARTVYDERSFAKELADNPHYDDLLLALSMADEADELTSHRFGAMDLHVENKPDHTPVTDADRATEQLIRDRLGKERPEDSIYGEELGKAASTGRRWIIDPIDGTKNFVRGVPVWATLIGLQDGDDIVLGVVSAPMLHNRWFAVRDGGAYMGSDADNAVRLHVSGVSDLANASLSLSSLSGWKERGDRDELIALSDRMWRLRGFGDFWQYMLVAQGAIDVAAEPELDLYDMAALVPIVEEAGGTFTDLEGNPGPWGGNGLASNGLLHHTVLQAL
ncbi:histidinol-phosphate phosphatase [Bifidobacterium psychraerophilum DSM 22366]|uniref:Histidinol-phosphatase n=2 Tax=Bifidobacterium psychraerophilum TaxID=218140 RepID=A0A087CDC8_9BIFI|nr:histidinol-phosphate phosphatase [Bifidobacterium psychraerophilum]PKA95621.1 histidinol-phosphate phosphatase [Bifidobacterium psychraerophilum DSM 22366]